MSVIEEIKAAVDEWNNGLDGGDIERMIASCHPDAITCNNGVETKIGTQAIRDKYNPLIAAYHINSEWEYENIQFYGDDMAIITGFFGGQMTDKKTGARTSHCFLLSIYQGGFLVCRVNKVVAVYALRDNTQPIDVAEYQLVELLPPELQSDMPSREQIERELADSPEH